MTREALYRRAVRRETHSPRSVPAIALAVVLILVLALLGVESVLAAIGQSPLLIAPATLLSSVLQATAAPAAILVACGALGAILGVALMTVSLTPGRRGRRAAHTDRTAALADDRVIAQAIAQSAAEAADVPANQVHVSVGSRSIGVDITPTSGRLLDEQAIRDAVDQELAGYDYRPALRPRVQVLKKGTIA